VGKANVGTSESIAKLGTLNVRSTSGEVVVVVIAKQFPKKIFNRNGNRFGFSRRSVPSNRGVVSEGKDQSGDKLPPLAFGNPLLELGFDFPRNCVSYMCRSTFGKLRPDTRGSLRKNGLRWISGFHVLAMRGNRKNDAHLAGNHLLLCDLPMETWLEIKEESNIDRCERCQFPEGIILRAFSH
jgi:hypothetical protein